MAETQIQWTWRIHPITGEQLPGYTFNPWIGCTKVSPACQYCYAEAMDARRFALNPNTGGDPENPISHWGKGAPRYRTKDWNKPKRWNKEAAKLGASLAVFCASLADWADEEVDPAWLVDLLDLIRTTPNLDWLLLTKRDPGAALMRAFNWLCQAPVLGPELTRTKLWLTEWLAGSPPTNVWLGATMENQEWTDKRMKDLLSVAAVVHFASMEPLVGPVVIPENVFEQNGAHMFHSLNWIISGGESNERDAKLARPVHPDHALAIAQQAWAHKVPFFWKQWGEWAPAYELDHNPQAQAMCAMDKVTRHEFGHGEGGRRFSYLVGVNMSGNLFEGKQCLDMPPVRTLLTT